MNVELVVCPTIRETDGLAMSSANALSIEERVAATCLFNALTARAMPMTAVSGRPRCFERGCRR